MPLLPKESYIYLHRQLFEMHKLRVRNIYMITALLFPRIGIREEKKNVPDDFVGNVCCIRFCGKP